MIILSAGALSCGRADDTPLPAPPWRQPAENPYGNVTSAMMERLAGHLQTAADAGKPTSETYYIVNDYQDVTALRDWYAVKAATIGHTPVSGLAGFLSVREAAFGYRKGKQVLLVGWISPNTTEPVPVVVQRYGASKFDSR